MNPAARLVRENILRVSHRSGHGHIPSCFSVVESLLAVYAAMRHDPAAPGRDDRDRFVLSKGHAALAHYCVLARQGYFPVDEVERFGGYCSTFGCHADRHKVPGVEASTGSLGHGIALAVGMALGLRIQGAASRVYTLVGDGEANEGSVWEALLAAADLRLANLTVLYDDNRSHGRGLQISNPTEKLAAFGCHVHEVDGHDLDALSSALAAPTDRVKAVVARTVKGFGCPTLASNHYAWHRRSPNDAELAQLLEELNAPAV